MAAPPITNSGCFCMPLQNGVMLMGLIDVVIGVCFAVFDGYDAPLIFRQHTVHTQTINHLDSSNNWYYNSDRYINSQTAASRFFMGPDSSRYHTRRSLEAVRHMFSTAIAGIVFAVLFWVIEAIFGLFLFIGAMMKSYQQCMVWICLTILLRIATVFLNICYHFVLVHAVEEIQRYGSESDIEYFNPGFTTAFVTLLIVLRCVAFIYKICEVVFVFMYSKEIKSSLELPAPTQTTTATLPQNQRSATGFQNKTIGLAQPSPSNYASGIVVGPAQPMPSYGGPGAVDNAQIKQV